MRKLAWLLALGLTGCLAAPPLPAPPPEGAVYVAQGTEPFWRLTINPVEMVFSEANAPGVQIAQPTPRVIVGFAGEIYQTPRMNVNIVHARCSDGMSDRVFPDKVQVRVDGRAFEGCGGEPMAPAQVANTSWQVLAVNARGAPPGDNFFVRFEGDRLSARFGCNSMSGPYNVQGGTLNAGALAMTRMACPDMAFEDQAARILSQPVRLNFQPGDRLLLENAAGSILLRRSY
jgi:heat shock protein HslJ